MPVTVLAAVCTGADDDADDGFDAVSVTVFAVCCAGAEDGFDAVSVTVLATV